ncbi:Hypothetical predicted protein [Marmota monax]|uniref:Uncharacterized protein n=1 Tax=Marmota monax TaxID=9995 RepID=A0A5E4AF49_MARMO|nr:hypothetical protein GHT09_000220 [Marmota monax]VTJ55914.1 Hypothetical predicted protein [Marmota monax]
MRTHVNNEELYESNIVTSASPAFTPASVLPRRHRAVCSAGSAIPWARQHSDSSLRSSRASIYQLLDHRLAEQPQRQETMGAESRKKHSDFVELGVPGAAVGVG